MPSKAKVWNKHPHGFTHKETFKEREIVIPAGEFIVMDYEEAVQFRGAYFPMKKDAMGQPDPKSFKCILIEPIADGKDAETEFISQIDGKKFPTKAALEAHLEQFRELVVKDEKLDEDIAQAAAAVKRGPGRPKEKTA